MGKDKQVDPIFGLSIEDEEPEEETPEAGEGATTAGPDEGQPPEAPDEGQADQGGPETKSQGQPDGQKPAQPQQQLIAGKFKSVEDLVTSYKELERKLGSRDEEKEQLRQQLAQAQQLLAQFQGALAPQAAPNLASLLGLPQGTGGQPTPPAPTQGQPQAEESTPEAEQQWLEQFYDKPKTALRELVRREFEREFYRQGRALGEMLRPFVAFTQREMAVREYEQRLNDLRQRHDDFDAVVEEFRGVLREMPQLVTLQSPAPGQPDGLEVAYQLAKVRKTAAQAAQGAQAQPPVSPETQKKAARMPASTGSRPTEAPKSADEQILDSIFGAANEPRGVFG